MRERTDKIDVRFVAPCLRDATTRAQSEDYCVERDLGVACYDNAVITFAGGLLANGEIVLKPPFGIEVDDRAGAPRRPYKVYGITRPRGTRSPTGFVILNF